MVLRAEAAADAVAVVDTEDAVDMVVVVDTVNMAVVVGTAHVVYVDDDVYAVGKSPGRAETQRAYH